MKHLFATLAASLLAVGAAGREIAPPQRAVCKPKREDDWATTRNERRRDIVMGKVRHSRGPRGMPAPGRLFKGHRP